MADLERFRGHTFSVEMFNPKTEVAKVISIESNGSKRWFDVWEDCSDTGEKRLLRGTDIDGCFEKLNTRVNALHKKGFTITRIDKIKKVNLPD